MAKKHKVAPKVTSVHYTMNEDGTLLIKSSDLLSHVNIESNAALNIMSISNPQGTLVNNNDATWSFTPSKYFSGSLTLDCIISDGSHKVVQEINIDVLHILHPFENPEVELFLQDDGSYLIYSRQLLQNATDIEGDNLDINSMSAPQGEFFNNYDGTWTFVPNAEYLGAIDLQFIVTDGKDSVTQNLLVTVNMPLVMPEINYFLSGNDALTFSSDDLLQSANDIEGDLLAITDIQAPESGQLINNGNGTWTYLPPENYVGPLKLQFGVSDSGGAMVDQSINIYTIAEELLTTPNQVLAMEDDGSVIITPDILLAYDPGLASNVIISNVASTQGTIKQVGNKDHTRWIFTPNELFSDIIDLQYIIDDGKKQTSRNISIEVESEEE